MNEKDWLILKTIYDEKNITRSAEQLFISQPALTYRLNQIEEELSVEIFNKTNKGIHFTLAGEYLVNYANQMTIHYQKLKDQLNEITKSTLGEIRIGVSSNFAHYKLPTILKHFLNQHPDIQVNVTTGWSKDIFKLFSNEEIHIAILRGKNSWKGPSILIDQDPLSLISKEAIDIKDLPKIPMISYKTDPNLKQIINQWWNDNYSEPPMISMEVDKLETCKEMVLNGLGYSIVPRYLISNNSKELFVKNIKTLENETIVRDLWMLYRVSKSNLTPVKLFVEFMKKN